MADVMTPHSIRTETDALLSCVAGVAGLKEYVYEWVRDSGWDLERPGVAGYPEFEKHSALLTVIAGKWKAYWETLAENGSAEKTERITKLVDEGFTLDGLLLASMTSGHTISSAVTRAENMVSGGW